jgi:hypothetical protein
MDALVLEDIVVHKQEGTEPMAAETREKYLAQFQLD